MLPSSPRILTCPFCNTEKRVVSLISGNDFDSTLWSDNKYITPMMLAPSYVQRCPHCGRYYTLTNQGNRYDIDGFSLEEGNLNFAETKEAFEQISKSGFLNSNEETQIRHMWLHAFNDYYHRDNQDIEIEADDKEFFDENALWLIDNGSLDEVLKAELYREIGMFDLATMVLDNYIPAEDWLADIADQIRTHAKNKDSKVFKIR